jgi:uncharacterized protein (TIRG00374 family)
MNRRFAIIQGLISLIALAAVIWWASKQDAPHLPDSSGTIAWLAGALVLYTFATLLRGERWHHILHLTGVDVHRRDSYALTTVGYMGNNVLPARAGEMLRVVLLSRRTEAGKRELLGTVVAERLLDAIALACIFIVVAYGALRGHVPADKPTFVLAVLAGLGVAALIVLQVLRTRGYMSRLREFARPLAGAPRALLSREGVLLLGGSFLIWGTEASVYLSVAHATSLGISGMGALYLMAATNLVAMLPAGPGYVGTFDAAVLAVVKHGLGGTSSQALSYLLMLRFVLFVPITVVGFIVLVTRYGGWSRLRAATRLEATSA